MALLINQLDTSLLRNQFRLLSLFSKDILRVLVFPFLMTFRIIFPLYSPPRCARSELRLLSAHFWSENKCENMRFLNTMNINIKGKNSTSVLFSYKSIKISLLNLKNHLMIIEVDILDASILGYHYLNSLRMPLFYLATINITHIHIRKSPISLPPRAGFC